jgi:MFS family permease
MALGRAPSVVDYCSLLALVSVVNGFYLAGPRRARYAERIGRWRLLATALLPSIAIAILLALVPSQRSILWWIPAIQAGSLALLATVAFPLLILRRHSDWPKAQPHERRALILVIGLLVLSALTPPIGMLLLTLATGDFRFAFALSLTAAYVLHWIWVLLVRPGAQRPIAGSPSDTTARSVSV